MKKKFKLSNVKDIFSEEEMISIVGGKNDTCKTSQSGNHCEGSCSDSKKYCGYENTNDEWELWKCSCIDAISPGSSETPGGDSGLGSTPSSTIF